ncbi:hypothetical protein [Protaetiibacter intestinalis]|uniref:Transporter n=1 Tax=Protaetiibacter intestinalis TaxID=2419774 RepID=A0A387BC65_9MICO|nr:hypothetical protein [Protaetiibacter intestinalis]AYF98695.1 hypothetical protein D7I47_10810 [Protaetiibacter intestinalis]
MNGFRRPPLQAVGVAVSLLLGLGGAAFVWFGSFWLHQWDDLYVMRATVVVGTWLSLAAVLIPLMAIRHTAIPPRAFLGYGLPPMAVALAFLMFALVGPGILLVPLAIAPVNAWPDAASVQVAWAAAPLLFLQGLLSIKLARQAGVGLRRRPGLAAWVDFLSVLLLAVGAVVVVVILAQRVPELRWVVNLARPFNELFLQMPGWLAMTPFGMLWAAPGYASSTVDTPAVAWQTLGAGVLVVLVLLVAWFAIVGYQLRPTYRLPAPRRTRVPGWFAHFPATPAGAIAARSVTYWMRDPRYRAVFTVLPAVPILMLLVCWVGGVPAQAAVLVPLPVMTLLLSWSTLHNDVAYDNTAVWQHVAAQTPGVDDRRGRSVPVLAWGALLLLVGIPLTVWGFGDLSLAAPLTGVCVALLLGGVGVGSAYSARFPYPATRPGDPAWQAPQVAGSQGGVAQSMSVFLVLLVAVPPFAAAVMWWIEGGWWGWVALAAGVASGVVVYVVGTRGGGASFDKRAPELLAFTQRN